MLKSGEQLKFFLLIKTADVLQLFVLELDFTLGH